jgi:hypothetical protein
MRIFLSDKLQVKIGKSYECKSTTFLPFRHTTFIEMKKGKTQTALPKEITMVIKTSNIYSISTPK